MEIVNNETCDNGSCRRLTYIKRTLERPTFEKSNVGFSFKITKIYEKIVILQI